MVVLEGMDLSGKQRVARAPFPLTPALSLGEREQPLPRWLQVHDAGCANQRSKMVHPLPEGEGQGEGEGTVKHPSRGAWKGGTNRYKPTVKDVGNEMRRPA